MSDVPVQLIVAAFQEEAAADQALKELKSAQKQKLIDIQDAAVIRRDEKNKLHIKETADPGGGKGAAAGGAIGAVIGLIAGPPLLFRVKGKGTKANSPIADKLVLTRQAESESVLTNQKAEISANAIVHQAYECQREKFQRGQRHVTSVSRLAGQWRGSVALRTDR